jgi:hypothetical protein
MPPGRNTWRAAGRSGRTENERAWYKDLEELKRAIEHAKSKYQNVEILENDPAGLLRKIFDHFGIPFSRGKDSPAIRTLWTILKMANVNTTMAGAESKIRAAAKTPKYEFVGKYAGEALSGLN